MKCAGDRIILKEIFVIFLKYFMVWMLILLFEWYTKDNLIEKTKQMKKIKLMNKASYKAPKAYISNVTYSIFLDEQHSFLSTKHKNHSKCPQTFPDLT